MADFVVTPREGTADFDVHVVHEHPRNPVRRVSGDLLPEKALLRKGDLFDAPKDWREIPLILVGTPVRPDSGRIFIRPASDEARARVREMLDRMQNPSPTLRDQSQQENLMTTELCNKFVDGLGRPRLPTDRELHIVRDQLLRQEIDERRVNRITVDNASPSSVIVEVRREDSEEVQFMLEFKMTPHSASRICRGTW